MNDAFLPQARLLLCDLQNVIRDALQAARATEAAHGFAEIAAVTRADTIYQIDKVSEAAITRWFEAHWPRDEPVELVMEGIEGDENLTFPIDARVTKWKCILDPIDGTRNLMFDKRSAWSLAALAPQRGADNRLSDLCVAAMTELPTSKMWRADQISGVRGDGLVCQSHNVLDRTSAPLIIAPSGASDFRHGFAGLARFFPEGKALTARIEEELWDELYGLGRSAAPLVFDDQYISTGGQLYELMVGHDRMIGDLRPLVLGKLGFESALVCHPYDICTGFLLQQAGGVLEAPDGTPLDAPLDTISPVAWMGYANQTLAQTVRPILQRLIAQYL